MKCVLCAQYRQFISDCEQLGDQEGARILLAGYERHVEHQHTAYLGVDRRVKERRRSDRRFRERRMGDRRGEQQPIQDPYLMRQA